MPIKLDEYSPFFYINLDDNIKRNDNITNIINRLGFKNVHRISAVDSRGDLINNYIDQIEPSSYELLLENNKQRKREFHEDLTNGAVGCTLSHISIFQKIVDEN